MPFSFATDSMLRGVMPSPRASATLIGRARALSTVETTEPPAICSPETGELARRRSLSMSKNPLLFRREQRCFPCCYLLFRCCYSITAAAGINPLNKNRNFPPKIQLNSSEKIPPNNSMKQHGGSDILCSCPAIASGSDLVGQHRFTRRHAGRILRSGNGRMPESPSLPVWAPPVTAGSLRSVIEDERRQGRKSCPS